MQMLTLDSAQSCTSQTLKHFLDENNERGGFEDHEQHAFGSISNGETSDHNSQSQTVHK